MSPSKRALSNRASASKMLTEWCFFSRPASAIGGKIRMNKQVLDRLGLSVGDQYYLRYVGNYTYAMLPADEPPNKKGKGTVTQEKGSMVRGHLPGYTTEQPIRSISCPIWSADDRVLFQLPVKMIRTGSFIPDREEDEPITSQTQPTQWTGRPAVIAEVIRHSRLVPDVADQATLTRDLSEVLDRLYGTVV